MIVAGVTFGAFFADIDHIFPVNHNCDFIKQECASKDRSTLFLHNKFLYFFIASLVAAWGLHLLMDFLAEKGLIGWG